MKMEWKEIRRIIDERNLTYHHTALARGYVRKKDGGYRYETYNGRFGEGIKVFRNCDYSSRFCEVDYYVKEN